ncbi:hypothetical protein IH824_09070 [candidate division KSB1 bacterium]|nr:hypothetical protein [candidate division KSB1 bacterium]
MKTAKLPGKSELKNFDELCVWGLQYYGHNQHVWPQIKNNDILFFYREKHYICTAIVEGKEDIFPDVMSKQVGEGYSTSPKAVEEQFANFI